MCSPKLNFEVDEKILGLFFTIFQIISIKNLPAPIKKSILASHNMKKIKH